LREFPGYTLSTLLAEDAGLIQLMLIEKRWKGDDGEGEQG
jgi:hypothetical protein